jgi:ribosome biogenesis protein
MEVTKDSTAQVPIKFTTRDPTVKLPDEDATMLVSTDLERERLSILVNNLLDSERPISFEFLIKGRFLRTSISNFLKANNLSSEVTLSLEYIRATIPPVHVASFEHDDWVSSVDVLSCTSLAAIWAGKGSAVDPGNARILSGGYDGLLRVWSTSSQLLAISATLGNNAVPSAIKAAKFLSPTKIVTTGNDRAIRVWRFQESPEYPGTFETKAKLEPALELFGHRSSVDSIAVHAPSSRLLSASSDHVVGLWSTSATEGPAPPTALLPTANSNKRRKTNTSSTSKSIPQRGPLSLLDGHSRPVSAAIFDTKDRTVGYSCSWDHAVITWDLTTSIAVSTRRTLHPLLCLAQLPEVGLLAAGTSARHIAMVDSRADAKDVTGLTLRGHTAPVVSVAPEPNNPWGLISASLDGTCRIWDVRGAGVDSTASGTGGAGRKGDSIYVIQRDCFVDGEKTKSVDGRKVFSVCWDKEVGIVSAGEDRRVQVNQPQ